MADGDTQTNSADGDSGNQDGNSGDLTAEVEKWKSFARKHEADAKKHLKELEKFQAANQTEQEKLLKSARDEGYNSAMSEAKQLFGQKLVAAKFEAAAAGRMEGKAIQALIGGLNVSSYLDDSGEVNTKAITEFVDTIAPPKSNDTGNPDKKDQSQQQVSRLDLGQGNQNGAGNSNTIPIGDDDAIGKMLENLFK